MLSRSTGGASNRMKLGWDENIQSDFRPPRLVETKSPLSIRKLKYLVQISKPELNWTEEVVVSVQVNQVTLCLTLFIWPLRSYICYMTWSKKWILNSHIWVQADDTFQCVNKVYLQKTAFSLVKSRLALGSSGWSFGCLFGCHHAKNGPIWLKNGCWLPPSDHYQWSHP